MWQYWLNPLSRGHKFQSLVEGIMNISIMELHSILLTILLIVLGIQLLNDQSTFKNFV